MRSDRRARRRLFGLAMMGVVAIGVTASAADVTGTLRIPDPPATGDPEGSRRAFYWEEWNGVLDPRPARIDARRELAVALTGGAAVGDLTRPTVRLFGGAPLPSTIVVRQGAVLRIVNEDDVPHELYAEGLDGFASEATNPAQARTVRLDRPGSWPLRDRRFPHVRGHLHVLPDLVAVVQPDAAGAFSVAGVPAGSYRLRVWLGATEVANQAVVVGAEREVALGSVPVSAPRAGAR